MAIEQFNIKHGCEKSAFTAGEMVKVHVVASDQILLHCYCPECKIVQVRDMSDECDSKYRKMLRQMFVRQAVIEIPDELFDLTRIESVDMHDYIIQFHEDLERFSDRLVSHRELQDSWENVVMQRD